MTKLLVLFVCVCVTTAYDFYSDERRDYKRTALGDSIDVSSMKVLETAYEAADDKNLVSSPLGLMMLLSLFSEGAGPATKRELAKFLGDIDVKQATDAFKDLTVKFSEMSPDYLTVADRISVSDKYRLNDTFATYAREYHSEFDALDFSDPKAAADQINKWASKKTEGHIAHPVSPAMLSPPPLVLLYNIIYFKGHWHVPFKARDTKKKDFHISRHQVVKKPMMHLYKNLYYAESPELGARLIELPYREDGFRMIVVLPNEVDGLSSVLKKAAARGLLSDISKLRPSNIAVELDIPKFDIRTKLDLNSILPKIGVSKIFEEEAPGIVKNAGVFVSKIFQEAFIKVDEKGSKAGAFTGMMANGAYPGEVPRYLSFNVDHPFLYAILHDDKILFAGTYSR